MTDQNNPGDTQGSEAPSVPEKFQDAEGNLDGTKLLQSYNELQAQFTQSRQAPKGDGTPQIPESPTSDGPLTLESFEDFFNEYAENGELAEESWESLEKQTGWHRDVIKDFAESKQLATAYQREKTYAQFGGEETVNEALQWAGQNMDESRVERLNAALAGGGEGGMIALENIINEFNASTGGASPVELRSGERNPGGSTGFRNKADKLNTFREAKRTGDYSEYDARLAATKDPASLQ